MRGPLFLSILNPAKLEHPRKITDLKSVFIEAKTYCKYAFRPVLGLSKVLAPCPSFLLLSIFLAYFFPKMESGHVYSFS